MRAKLEDTAAIVHQTGGLHFTKKRFKCRKLDFNGAVGDIYFEQPSMTLIESGLWCNQNERNLPYLRQLCYFKSTDFSGNEYINSVKCTYIQAVGKGGEEKSSGRVAIGR